MSARRFISTIGCLALLGLSTQSPASAGADWHKTMYVTFNRPVALPGTALASGTYIFELADSDGTWPLVRVMSRQRDHVYFLGFTYAIDRAAGMRHNQVITFGEAVDGEPTPIKAWYPAGDARGREFMYPR
jgi:hypothetical protein